MIEKYIVSDGDNKILLIDDNGKIREIDNNENNLEIINLENVIETIKQEISVISNDINSLKFAKLANVLFLAFGTYISFFAGKIGYPLILSSDTGAFISGIFLEVIAALGLSMDIFAIVSAIKQKKEKLKLGKMLNNKLNIISKYEKDLEQLKQKVEVNENDKNSVHKKSFVYEFNPELIKEATREYVDDNKRSSFKKRVLTK